MEEHVGHGGGTTPSRHAYRHFGQRSWWLSFVELSEERIKVTRSGGDFTLALVKMHLYCHQSRTPDETRTV